MSPHKIPYKFNPGRHKRLLRYARFRKIALVLFVMSVSFLMASMMFGREAAGGLLWIMIGMLVSTGSGALFFYLSRMLKEEHR